MEVLLVDATFAAEIVVAVFIEAVSGCSSATNTVPSSSDGCDKRLLRFLEVLLDALVVDDDNGDDDDGATASIRELLFVILDDDREGVLVVSTISPDTSMTVPAVPAWVTLGAGEDWVRVDWVRVRLKSN